MGALSHPIGDKTAIGSQPRASDTRAVGLTQRRASFESSIGLDEHISAISLFLCHANPRPSP